MSYKIIIIITLIVLLSITLSYAAITDNNIVYKHQRIPLYEDDGVKYVLYLPVDADLNMNYNPESINSTIRRQDLS